MNRRFFNTTQKVIPFLVSVAITCAMFFASRVKIHDFQPFIDLEFQVYDTFINMRNAKDYGKYQAMSEKFQDKMFIVTINDSTIKAYGRFSEWSREKTEILLKRLKKAGAKVVFVDMLFTEPSRNVKLDEELAEEYAENRGLILPAKIWRGRDLERKLNIELPLFHVLAEILPDLELKKLFINRSGIVTVEDIRGGRVRAVPMAASVGKNTYIYNISLLCYLSYMGLDTSSVRLTPQGIIVGNKTIPLHEEKFYINYIVKHLTLEPGQTYGELFPLCDTGPLEDILSFNDKDLESLVKNKIVLVGAATPSLGDIKDTPMGSMPGIFINALIIANMLEGLYITFAPAWMEFLSMLALGFIVAAISSFLRPLTAGIFSVLAGGAYFYLAFEIFRHHSLLIPVAPALSSVVLHILILISYFYFLEEKRKNQIKSIFGEYLSPVVVESLIDHQVRGNLGIDGKKEVVSIFYSDIRGFTSMSENMKPEEVVALLNEYFDRMAEIVIKHGGYIDKYIGDCLMAVFSAPVPTERDAIKAAIAAVEQQEEIMRLKEEWKKDGRDKFFVGMGINTGEVILGNIGSPRKKDYTVIGDNVNLAARLYDKARGGQILISHATYEYVKDTVECRPVGTMTVKGKTIPVEVYEILGLKGKTNLLEGYDEGPRKGGH